MGSGLKNIGDSAVENCKSLIIVTIPDNVVSVGRGIFTGCVSLSQIDYTPDLLPTLDRDTGWSGITCNPFEGSLMSERYSEMGLCPRCGGRLTFISKEELKAAEERNSSSENVPDFIKNAISHSSLLQRAVEIYKSPKQKNSPVGFYDCSFYKCIDCGFKKIYRPVERE